MTGAASGALETIYNTTSIPLVASHRSADVSVPTGDFMNAGGFYNPQKVRISLQLAVATGYGREEIREMFALNYPM